MHVSLLRRLWVTFSVHVIGSYASLFNSLQVSGAGKIPSGRGVLIASNHISAFDTIFLPWVVIRRFPLQMLWAPAKEELFRNTVMGWIYSSWGAFPVNRGRDVRAARRINDLLQTEKVMIFPEGTRHKDGVLGKGNRGVGKIIYDTRPVVIPAALIGLNQWQFPRCGQKAEIRFGPPLEFADLLQLEDNKVTHQLIVDRVMAAIAVLLTSEAGE